MQHLARPPGGGRARAGLSLAMALTALVAVTASAVAEPPTTIAPEPGPFAPLTLRVDAPADAIPSPASPRDPSASIVVLFDPGIPPMPSTGSRRQPVPDAGVTVKRTPRPDPPALLGGTDNVLRGQASWYCNDDGSRAPRSSCHYRYPDTRGFDAYAAAGPRLRAALGGGERWRGRIVSVDGIRVKLVDWCQCHQGQPNEKVIDLYYDVFNRVGDDVTIRW